MDNPTFPPPSTAAARFVPDRRYTAASGAGVLLAVTVAVLTGDRLGRVLMLVAAVLLAAYVVSDLVFSPRLEADAAGVVIRSPFTRAVLRWDQIETIDVVSRMRLGLRNAALEIDAGAVLAEFSRRSLSVEPEAALAQILAVRPR